MTRAWSVAILGLLLGSAAFFGLSAAKTAGLRRLELECGPDLVWLKQEFHLSEADFTRIRVLHEEYKPKCAEMCRRVDEQHRELARLLQTATEVTPEIAEVMNRAAQLRKQCQIEMLGHFFRVSQAMPPDEGRRYLAWMQEQTLSPSHDSMVAEAHGASPNEPAEH